MESKHNQLITLIFTVLVARNKIYQTIKEDINPPSNPYAADDVLKQAIKKVSTACHLLTFIYESTLVILGGAN